MDLDGGSGRFDVFTNLCMTGVIAFDVFRKISLIAKSFEAAR